MSAEGVDEDALLQKIWIDASDDLMKQGYIALGFALRSVKNIRVDANNVRVHVESRSNRALFGIKENVAVVNATLKKLTGKPYFLTVVDEVSFDGGSGNVIIELNRLFGEKRLKIKD